MHLFFYLSSTMFLISPQQTSVARNAEAVAKLGDELDEPNPVELDVRAVTAAELEPGQG